MEEVDIYQLQIIEAALKHYKVHLAATYTSENDSESSNQFNEIEQFMLPKLQAMIQAAQDGKLDQSREESQGTLELIDDVHSLINFDAVFQKLSDRQAGEPPLNAQDIPD